MKIVKIAMLVLAACALTLGACNKRQATYDAPPAQPGYVDYGK